MIVRILNEKADRDSFFDCRNSCVQKKQDKAKKWSVTMEFAGKNGKIIEILLEPGDRIYYMNDSGKTIQADCRMLN